MEQTLTLSLLRGRRWTSSLSQHLLSLVFLRFLAQCTLEALLFRDSASLDEQNPVSSCGLKILLSQTSAGRQKNLLLRVQMSAWSLVKRVRVEVEAGALMGTRGRGWRVGFTYSLISLQLDSGNFPWKVSEENTPGIARIRLAPEDHRFRCRSVYFSYRHASDSFLEK